MKGATRHTRSLVSRHARRYVGAGLALVVVLTLLMILGAHLIADAYDSGRPGGHADQPLCGGSVLRCQPTDLTPTLPSGSRSTSTPSVGAAPEASPTAQRSGDGVVSPRDDATCRALAQQHGDRREAIPANATANAKNEWVAGVRPAWDGQDTAQVYMGRVSGNFIGTTDQILTWVACKWGFPLDVVRAQASQESDWRQSLLGDCGATTQPQTGGCASVGILQVKGADLPPTHRHTWPYAYESTSWNADYAFAVRRACYDGKIDWLRNGYHAGDLWGCIGQWFSGGWHDGGAEDYIALVKQRLAGRTWESYYS